MLTLEHFNNITGGAEWLTSNFGKAPELAIITGSSGPHELRDHFTNAEEVELEGHFPLPTVEGHFQHIIYGELRGKPAIWFPGRTHLNEHGDVHKAVMTSRTLGWWGCSQFITTNLVGSLDEKFPVGSIVVVEDHLSLFSGSYPLIGNADILDRIGGVGSSLHVDMSQPYSRRMIDLVKQIDPRVQEVVLAMRPGREFETRADVRALRMLGANTVGMSTIPDVIALNHMAGAKERKEAGEKIGRKGIEICVLSQISNVAGAHGLSHKDNLLIAKKGGPAFAKLIADLAGKL